MEVTTEQVVEYLNSIYKADPNAIHSLMCNRVPCTNDNLLNHPHFVVSNSIAAEGTNLAGVLGMINGMLTSLKLEKVALSFDDETHKCLGFIKVKE